jgi:hypothetical protein
MTAIEIRVNGELKATCGADGLRQLVAMVAARRPKGDTEFKYVVECMGVRPKNASTEEVLKWVNTRLTLGDEVSFKVVNVAKAQAPFDRQEIPARDEQAT